MRLAFGLVLLALLVPALSLSAQQEGMGGPSIHLMGFGDVNYLHQVTRRDGVPDGFRLGQMVGHVNAGLTERITFFGEFSATARPDGFGIEVERMILRYDFSDLVKVSLGRYHTPISFWNVAYHHGAWLQTAIARPEMIKFGSQLLPVHFVGVQVEGNVPATPLGLGYAVGVGNGRGTNIARAGDAGDIDRRRAVSATLFARPQALVGLQVGGSLYLDRATPAQGAAVDERILSAHVARQWESPEVLAEYARLWHEPVDGEESVASDAWYAQVGYRLPGDAQAFKPYARLERVDIPATNPLLGQRNLGYRAGILGVRYDFAPFAALKAEFRDERFAAPGSFRSLHLQASFAVSGAGGGAQHLSGLFERPAFSSTSVRRVVDR
ncbi:MAG TPA: hypothetical protein VGR27_05160 [Longimicrobiaceae bacterium]|nr:hypothetical protein [Longimicrobiaceae bacterium]